MSVDRHYETPFTSSDYGYGGMPMTHQQYGTPFMPYTASPMQQNYGLPGPMPTQQEQYASPLQMSMQQQQYGPMPIQQQGYPSPMPMPLQHQQQGHDTAHMRSARDEFMEIGAHTAGDMHASMPLSSAHTADTACHFCVGCGAKC